jgi:hypothetical protein
MSTANEWDSTVPEDDAELLAELRRHGMRPGIRPHVALSPQEAESSPEEAPAFFGSFRSGQPDLAKRSSEILQAEFPDAGTAGP